MTRAGVAHLPELPEGARNLRVVVSYDGTDFSGWQRQPGMRTVEGCLEDGIRQLLGEEVFVRGAGLSLAPSQSSASNATSAAFTLPNSPSISNGAAQKARCPGIVTAPHEFTQTSAATATAAPSRNARPASAGAVYVCCERRVAASVSTTAAARPSPRAGARRSAKAGFTATRINPNWVSVETLDASAPDTAPCQVCLLALASRLSAAIVALLEMKPAAKPATATRRSR